MIFSKKIYKIGKGKNVSLWARDLNHMNLYLFTKKVVKFNLDINNTIKITPTDESYGYKSIIKINNDYHCASYDENMTVSGNTI